MTTLTLNKSNTSTGLGCLNGLACPSCNAPMVDTLNALTLSKTNVKDCYCPMCEFEGQYHVQTGSITKTKTS